MRDETPAAMDIESHATEASPDAECEDSQLRCVPRDTGSLRENVARRVHQFGRDLVCRVPPRWAVYGAGDVGRTLVSSCRRLGSCPVAFVETDPTASPAEIDGIPVLSPAQARDEGLTVFALATLASVESMTATLRLAFSAGGREFSTIAVPPPDARSERVKYEQMWSFDQYRGDHVTRHAEHAMDLWRGSTGDSVIDFGAGAGHACACLQQRGFRVLALDIAANSLDPALRDRIPILVACLWDLPVSLSADWGFCCDMLEHVPTERVHDVMAAIRASTRRATYVSVSVRPDGCGALIGDLLHLTVRPPEWWAEQLAQHWHRVDVVSGEPGECADFFVDGVLA